MVMVSTERLRLMAIKLNEEFYAKHNIFAMNGIVEVLLNVAFKLIVGNYDSGEYRLAKNQILAHLLLHAGKLVHTSIRLMEILGVTEKTSSSKDVTV